MVNSNVPHLRSLVSVSCIEIIVQVKILITSTFDQTNMMAPLSALCERSDYKLVHLNSTVRSYSLIRFERWLQQFFRKNQTRTTFQSPKLEDFSQTLRFYVHFGAVSLIHSAPQWNAATPHKVLAPLSGSYVIAIDSCSLLSRSFSLFFSLSWFYSNQWLRF